MSLGFLQPEVPAYHCSCVIWVWDSAHIIKSLNSTVPYTAFHCWVHRVALSHRVSPQKQGVINRLALLCWVVVGNCYSSTEESTGLSYSSSLWQGEKQAAYSPVLSFLSTQWVSLMQTKFAFQPTLFTHSVSICHISRDDEHYFSKEYWYLILFNKATQKWGCE